MTEYGYAVEIPQSYDEAVIRTRLALRGEGFSIITEMHVGGVLGPETGDERQYLIMGAWTPDPLEREIGGEVRAAIHLPCNLVVQEADGGALIAALDPGEDAEGVDESTAAIVETARRALARVLNRVAGATDG